jgi:hypothetical protein
VIPRAFAAARRLFRRLNLQLKGTLAMTRRLAIPIAVIAATASLLLANPASATPPTTEETPADYSQSFTGADSPCGFDITFSAAGTVTVTTYYDNTGTPIRESIHGSLAHTVSSAWHTLSSKGPAPVHIDLTASVAIDTGKEFAFHIPGSGVVWAQNGRFVFGDIGLISYTGLNSLDTNALCGALAS